MFASKKDSSLCFCVNYQTFNGVNIRDSNDLLLTNECMDTVGQVAIFSMLDVSSGYWRLKTYPRDRENAFICHQGIFKLKRMPFGLRITPDIFQKAMDVILSTFKVRAALVYLENIITLSETTNNSMLNLWHALTWLTNCSLKLNLTKCWFLAVNINHHVHVSRPDRTEIVSTTTSAIKELKNPTSRTRRRSFSWLFHEL